MPCSSANVLYWARTIVKASAALVKDTTSSPSLIQPLAGYFELPMPVGIKLKVVALIDKSADKIPSDLRGALALSPVIILSVSLPVMLAPLALWLNDSMI